MCCKRKSCSATGLLCCTAGIKRKIGTKIQKDQEPAAKCLCSQVVTNFQELPHWQINNLSTWNCIIVCWYEVYCWMLIGSMSNQWNLPTAIPHTVKHFWTLRTARQDDGTMRMHSHFSVENATLFSVRVEKLQSAEWYYSVWSELHTDNLCSKVGAHTEQPRQDCTTQ